MTTLAPTNLNATPEAIASVRARLQAEVVAREQKPPAARLCPTVRRLLECRRKGARARA